MARRDHSSVNDPILYAVGDRVAFDISLGGLSDFTPPRWEFGKVVEVQGDLHRIEWEDGFEDTDPWYDGYELYRADEVEAEGGTA